MQATESVSRLKSHFLTPTGPLNKADGVEILGAALSFLREKDVVCSLSEMHANHSAQGTLEKLRQELWRECYGRKE